MTNTPQCVYRRGSAPTMIALPVVQPAPLLIEELEPVLQNAGLMLVQTAAEKFQKPRRD